VTVTGHAVRKPAAAKNHPALSQIAAAPTLAAEFSPISAFCLPQLLFQLLQADDL
jgi:hypothetical protein